MHITRNPSRRVQQRRGLTTPAVALALLVMMAGMALVLDRIWLETAQFELTTAAEATALAAARQLASDDRLLADADPEQRLDLARNAAELVSLQNRVVGQPPSFSSDRDLLFGNYTQPKTNELARLDVEADDPLTVRAILHRTRARNNPVALFVGQVTGLPFGDVLRAADATINNHITAIRPVVGATAPTLPLAIWKVDPSGNRQDTWTVQIDQRKGPDQYRFDAESSQVVEGQDGIPEIQVRSVARGGSPETCNVQVVDLGTDFDQDKLKTQFYSGWSELDLEAFGGELSLGKGLTLTSSAQILAPEQDALLSLLGEPRICLLFTTAVPTGQDNLCDTTCVEFVAIRVMDVQDQGDGSCIVVLQPTVLATRAAVIAASGSTTPAVPNKYIYNLQLTN
jgi:hypothetical protein